MGDRAERWARAVEDALEALVRELLARRPDGHLLEGRLDGLEVRLPLDRRAAGPGFAHDLVAALEAQLAEAVEDAFAFRPGHAWCHRCSSASCEHGLPPSPRHVFIGYAPTGLPRWEDFAQACLDRRHPRVDELYEDPPALLTLVDGGTALAGGLLEVYAHGRLELLGQVATGFFPLSAREGEGRVVVALSAQVMSSTRGGRRRLALNVLGRAPGGEDLGTLWERQRHLPWHGPVRWAQGALATLDGTRGSREGLERRVGGILGGLARRLERETRARARKTRHALVRHDSGKRPTRKALDDARTAGPEAVLVDERSGALVVLGDRGRTHFFTVEGRLVSSVRYSREAIARKRERERWRPASPSETAELLGKLVG